MANHRRAFGRDRFLRRRFVSLFKKHAPSLIIETGTYRASTTKFFAEFKVPVITTEIESRYYLGNFEILSHLDNVLPLLGDSPTLLRKILPLIADKKAIAFLDSHGKNDEALERELDLFVLFSRKPILMIHDFKVPNSELKYDTWDGHEYCFETFQNRFDAIYGKGLYDVSYNDEKQASGARRGCIILEPKNA